MKKEWEPGDFRYLSEPKNYKGYRLVELVEFDAVRMQWWVRTMGGWEFAVYEDELEEE